MDIYRKSIVEIQVETQVTAIRWAIVKKWWNERGWLKFRRNEI